MYVIGHMVTVKWKQFGNVIKLKAKYMDPYDFTAFKNYDRYEVKKLGYHVGPGKTLTGTEYNKKVAYMLNT